MVVSQGYGAHADDALGAAQPGVQYREHARAWLLSPRRLHLTLFATEKCNFRCTYCYEDFSHGAMSADVASGICALLSRRASDLEQLSISWFGGEPLLASSVMTSVGAHAKQLADYFGFSYNSGVTTNAWLLDLAMASRLLEAGISGYQITLDGPANLHDKTRLLAGGGGTFDRVWGNIWALHASQLPVQVMVRCHVTADNAGAWADIAPDVLRLLADPRFALHVHKVGRWGGPNDADLHEADDAQVEAVKAALGGGTHEAAIEEICYAAAPSSLLVRADGSLGRCTVALNDPRNRVGYLTTDGRVVTNLARLRPWFAGWEGDVELLACPIRGLPSADNSSGDAAFLGMPSVRMSGSAD